MEFVSGIFSLIILRASKTKVLGLNCRVLAMFKSTSLTLMDSRVDCDELETVEADMDDGLEFNAGLELFSISNKRHEIKILNNLSCLNLYLKNIYN